MILTYENYLSTLAALQEHVFSKGVPMNSNSAKKELFIHLVLTYGTFIAVNPNGEKMLCGAHNMEIKKSKDFRSLLQRFKNHMDNPKKINNLPKLKHGIKSNPEIFCKIYGSKSKSSSKKENKASLISRSEVGEGEKVSTESIHSSIDCPK